MTKSRKDKPRLPPAAGGIQVNFCKNPACGNYNSPASVEAQQLGRHADPSKKDSYILGGTGYDVFIQCRKCRETPPVKSNQGIKEELDRITAYLRESPDDYSCPNPDCSNHGVGINHAPKSYWAFGKTAIGSPRYRCKQCGRTFSIAQKSTHRQRIPHKNIEIFRELVTKKAFKGLAEVKNISMETVYRKVDFIYEQCVAFAAHRESKLPELKKRFCEIAVDRQVYSINWSSKKDRRNIKLWGIASADRVSGYIFGAHVNYDPNFEPQDVEADAVQCGDYDVPPAYRKYARFWLAGDYIAEAEKLKKEKKAKKGEKEKPKTKDDSVETKAAKVYEDALKREDVEACDAADLATMLPPNGMQVHAEYTMYAHFFFLRHMLQNVENIRFYMDQDSGIRAACLAAFSDRILEKTCDAFYVQLNTEFTEDEKLALVAEGRKTLKRFTDENPHWEDVQDHFVRREVIAEMLKDLLEIGAWKDRWLKYPFPTKSEPEKLVCYLTNIKKNGLDRKVDTLAYMYDRATLHPIDRFLMQTRRASSIHERSVRSPNRVGRIWQIYNAYDPHIVVKLLEIYRVYYNYVKLSEGTKRKKPKDEPKRKPGEAKAAMKTPAMRLGLAKGGVTIDEILYFRSA